MSWNKNELWKWFSYIWVKFIFWEIFLQIEHFSSSFRLLIFVIDRLSHTSLVVDNIFIYFYFYIYIYVKNWKLKLKKRKEERLIRLIVITYHLPICLKIIRCNHCPPPHWNQWKCRFPLSSKCSWPKLHSKSNIAILPRIIEGSC